MAKSVIIIGAGLGGLTAAIQLARLGYDVTVLEKNAHAGGKVCEFRASGFRWDIAPAPFAPKVALDELFQELGQDSTDYLRLQPVEPSARYFFPDGASFSASNDWPSLAAEIKRLAPDDYIGFLDYLAFAARLDRSITGDTGNVHSEGLPLFPRRAMRHAIARYIRSAKLQTILGYAANSVGGSAYGLPVSFNALVHQALTGGSAYPQDGMQSLATALLRLARENGATVQFNSPVEEIQLAGKAVRGVALADSQTITADAVVSSVDVVSTLRFLLPTGALPAPVQRRLNRLRMSASAFVILLGIRGRFPQLAHHNIFFSHNRQREYQDIFQRDVMPADPTIELTISSKSDPLSAPVNQENWLIKAQAPPLSEKFDWGAQRQAYRDRVLAILQERYGLDLRDRIRIEQHLTPADFQAMTGAWRGSLFGRSAHERGASIAAPAVRSSLYARLYFAGGTTQPGGDNALGIRSGRAAAQAVGKDLG